MWIIGVITAVFLTACRAETIPPTPIMLATIPAELATQAALSQPPTPIITPQTEGETAVSIQPTTSPPKQAGEPAGEPWRVGIASNVPDGLAQEVKAFVGRHPDQFTWVG
ncbi:MAG: hypothetical protein GWP17_06050, partial [Aquificales bacterium]|nr:hypothetical protein [Aquificales bacterium]